MGRIAVILSFIAIVLVLIFWAPWLTTQYAEEKVIDQFNSAWAGVADGCGFNCAGCGVTRSERTLLGFKVEIEYACGLIPEDTLDYHQVDHAFVSIFGIVTGLETP